MFTGTKEKRDGGGLEDGKIKGETLGEESRIPKKSVSLFLNGTAARPGGISI